MYGIREMEKRFSGRGAVPLPVCLFRVDLKQEPGKTRYGLETKIRSDHQARGMTTGMMVRDKWAGQERR